MRVCHITSCHGEKDTRIFYKECVSLAKKDYEVFLVSPGKKNEVCKGVHIIAAGERPNNRVKRMFSFAKQVIKKSLNLRADVYHIHDPELLIFVKQLKKTGAKIVFDSHENVVKAIATKPYLPKVIAVFFSKVYHIYINLISRYIDGVIGVTPNHYNDLKIYNSPIEIITNYPIISYNYVEHEKTDEVKLCFTGGISDTWCMKNVIEAVQNSSSNIKLLLCGPVDQKYFETVIKPNLSEKIEYLGKLSYDEAMQVQKQSDIGVAIARYSPALDDDIGTLGNTKIFEYMIAGLPVVCTDFILWKKIIDETKCGFYVSPNDVKCISDLFDKLANSYRLRKEFGRNARIASEQKYNWETQEEILYRFYETILENKYISEIK